MAFHRGFGGGILKQYVLPGVTPTGNILGTGSYGTVLEVNYEKLKCAAKKIHDLFLMSDNMGVETMVLKYEQECQIMASLRHPNITQFLGICYLPDAQLPLLVMEKLDMSLDDLLEYVPNIPITLKVSFLQDISRGLHYLHKGYPPIIHRDLTANNILLTSSLSAKITDMGNARIVPLRPGQLARTLSKLPGTLAYMPPEALSDHHRYGPSLDIFSFGHLALYTLIQEYPGDLLPHTYCDPNNRGRVQGRTEIERRVRYIEALESQIFIYNPALVGMVKQCLDNDPRERPSSEDLLDRIHAIKQDIERSHGGSSFEIVDVGRVQLVKAMKQNQKKKELEMRFLVEEKIREIENLQQKMVRLHDQIQQQEDELRQQREEIHQKVEEVQQQREQEQHMREEMQHQNEELHNLNEALAEIHVRKEEVDHMIFNLLESLTKLEKREDEHKLKISRLINEVRKCQEQLHSPKSSQEIMEFAMTKLIKEKVREAETIQLENNSLLEQVQHQDEVVQQLRDEVQQKNDKIQKQNELSQQQEEEIQFQRIINQHKTKELRNLTEAMEELQQQNKKMEHIVLDLQSSQEFTMIKEIKEKIGEAESLQLENNSLLEQVQHQDEVVQQLRDEVQQKSDIIQQQNELSQQKEEEIQFQRIENQHKAKELRNLTEAMGEVQQQKDEMEHIVLDLKKSLSISESIENDLRQEIRRLVENLQQHQEHLHLSKEEKMIQIPLQMKWTRGPDMPFGMQGYIQSVVIRELLYVGGGDCSIDSPNNYIVMVYNTQTGKWDQLPPYSAQFFSMVAINNQLVLVGGCDSKYEPTNALSMWNASNKEWKHSYKNMPTARYFPSAVAYKQWLIVAGGRIKNRLSNVEVFDAVTDQWYGGRPTPVSWSTMKSTLVGDIWYLMGGYIDKQDNPTNIMYSVSMPDLIHYTISNMSSHKESMWKMSPLSNHYSTPLSFNGSLLAVGGLRAEDETPIASFYCFVPENEEFIYMGKLPVSMYNFSCAISIQQKILVLGGPDLSSVSSHSFAMLKSSSAFYTGTSE